MIICQNIGAAVNYHLFFVKTSARRSDSRGNLPKHRCGGAILAGICQNIGAAERFSQEFAKTSVRRSDFSREFSSTHNNWGFFCLFNKLF